MTYCHDCFANNLYSQCFGATIHKKDIEYAYIIYILQIALTTISYFVLLNIKRTGRKENLSLEMKKKAPSIKISAANFFINFIPLVSFCILMIIFQTNINFFQSNINTHLDLIRLKYPFVILVLLCMTLSDVVLLLDQDFRNTVIQVIIEKCRSRVTSQETSHEVIELDDFP